MRYYISDLHFFHDAVIHRMDKRGFIDCEEMNEYIVEKWNKKVRKNDSVVILGDVSFGNGTVTNEILERLNGELFLIQGNHDRYYLNDRRFKAERFTWIRPYEELYDEKRKVILSHYPIFCYNGQYRLDSAGNPRTYMLYGHVHNSFDEILVNRFINETRASVREILNQDEPGHIPCNMINCFCMFSDYEPLSLTEWIEVDAKRRQKMNEEAREAGGAQETIGVDETNGAY